VSALDEYPRTVVLKDGAHLTLRPVAAGDGPAVAAFRARQAEAATAPLADVPSAAADRAVTIAALDGARVAGLLVLVRDGAPVEAEIRVALDAAYAGRRLGTWMLLDAVHLAAALGVVRLGASVRAGAETEQAALRRLDFVEDPSGGAPGLRRFVKAIHAGWTDF